MKQISLLAILLFSTSSVTTAADKSPGQTLLDTSTGNLTWYVAGVLEGYDNGILFGDNTVDMSCTAGKNFDQIAAVVRKWIEANPESWDKSRAFLVLAAVDDWCR